MSEANITRGEALRKEMYNMKNQYERLFTQSGPREEYQALDREYWKMTKEERSLPEYSFFGNVIKLNYKHYNDWFSQVSDFMNEPTFLKELSKIDDWMSQDESRKGNWFYRVPKMLQKKREAGAF